METFCTECPNRLTPEQIQENSTTCSLGCAIVALIKAAKKAEATIFGCRFCHQTVEKPGYCDRDCASKAAADLIEAEATGN